MTGYPPENSYHMGVQMICITIHYNYGMKLQVHVHIYLLLNRHILTGSSNEVQSIDALWCMKFESVAAPKLCPAMFEDTAKEVLHAMLGLTADVAHTNCRSIYLQLI